MPDPKPIAIKTNGLGSTGNVSWMNLTKTLADDPNWSPYVIIKGHRHYIDVIGPELERKGKL